MNYPLLTVGQLRHPNRDSIICGGKLKRAKEILGFGQFGRWCKSELPKISEKTIQNYMRLYNALGGNPKAIADQPTMSLQKAYIQLGIIKEASDGETLSVNASIVNGKCSASLTTEKPILILKKPSAKSGKDSKIITKAPAISVDDALSRPRYLVGELINDMNNKLNNKNATRAQLEDAVMKPLSRWFEQCKES